MLGLCDSNEWLQFLHFLGGAGLNGVYKYASGTFRSKICSYLSLSPFRVLETNDVRQINNPKSLLETFRSGLFAPGTFRVGQFVL